MCLQGICLPKSCKVRAKPRFVCCQSGLHKGFSLKCRGPRFAHAEMWSEKWSVPLILSKLASGVLRSVLARRAARCVPVWHTYAPNYWGELRWRMMTLSGQRMRTPIRHGFCIVPAGDAGMENIIVGSGKPAGRTRRMIEVATMKCCCRAFFLIVVLVTVGCEAKRPPQASRPAPTTGSDSVKPVAATDTTPSPAKPLTDKPLTAKPLTGPELYARHCGACHGSGVLGAPKTGDTAAWKARADAGGGIDGLLKR